MIGAIDRWIGSRLFVPAIVRVCQAAGITQFRFSSYAFMVAAIALVARGPARIGWIVFIIMSLLAAVRVIGAALIPDRRSEGSVFWRRFSLVLIVVHTVVAALDLLGDVFWLAALAAEYALTIHTIPPREAREPRRKLAPQRLR